MHRRSLPLCSGSTSSSIHCSIVGRHLRGVSRGIRSSGYRSLLPGRRIASPLLTPGDALSEGPRCRCGRTLGRMLGRTAHWAESDPQSRGSKRAWPLGRYDMVVHGAIACPAFDASGVYLDVFCVSRLMRKQADRLNRSVEILLKSG